MNNKRFIKGITAGIIGCQFFLTPPARSGTLSYESLVMVKYDRIVSNAKRQCETRKIPEICKMHQNLAKLESALESQFTLCKKGNANACNDFKDLDEELKSWDAVLAHTVPPMESQSRVAELYNQLLAKSQQACKSGESDACRTVEGLDELGGNLPPVIFACSSGVTRKCTELQQIESQLARDLSKTPVPPAQTPPPPPTSGSQAPDAKSVKDREARIQQLYQRLLPLAQQSCQRGNQSDCQTETNLRQIGQAIPQLVEGCTQGQEQACRALQIVDDNLTLLSENTPINPHPPKLGISVQTVTPEMAQTLNVASSTRGAVITDILPNSPADMAGLAPGDIIQGIDNQRIQRGEDIVALIAKVPAGSPVGILIRRQNQEQFYVIQLAGADSPSRPTPAPSPPSALPAPAAPPMRPSSGDAVTDKLLQDTDRMLGDLAKQAREQGIDLNQTPAESTRKWIDGIRQLSDKCHREGNEAACRALQRQELQLQGDIASQSIRNRVRQQELKLEYRNEFFRAREYEDYHRRQAATAAQAGDKEGTRKALEQAEYWKRQAEQYGGRERSVYENR